MTSRTNILTFGTFDLFHYGHLKILQRAKSLGEHLTVAVSTDEACGVGGKNCIIPYSQRSAIVGGIKYVDAVVPHYHWGSTSKGIEEKATIVERLSINTLVMGNDWEGKLDEIQHLCHIIYLPRTEGVSSTQIKKIILG